MNWLTRLFGSSKSVDTVVETAAKGIYNGLDALMFTDEEKAQYRAEQAKMVNEFALAAYDQNSIRSITRRWLAFMVMGPCIGFMILAAVFHGIGLVLAEPGQYSAAVDYAAFLFQMASNLLPWAGGVLAFYFGGHLVGAIRGGKAE